MMSQRADVFISGAGSAGLAAARALSARRSLSVIVLEARDRVGGRIYMRHDKESLLPVELGAEFVHGKPPEIFEVAERARLTLCDVTDRHWYSRGGALIKSGEFWDKLEDVMDEMREAKHDQSFAEFLRAYDQDGSLG